MAALGERRSLALPDTIAAWRNRMIGSRRFQAWASAFPLTRKLARRDGERLFDLMAGFVYAQVLSACTELGVLRLLRSGPQSAPDVGVHTGLDPERAAALCQAAAALGLLDRCADGRFRLGRLGAAALGVPGIEAMVRHHRVLYGDLADPAAFLRRQTDPDLARFWPYVLGGSGDEATAETYSELMAGSQALVAEETLRCERFRGARHLMDVGGGTGAFLGAVGAAHPGLRLTLFDLPEVIAAAARRQAAGTLDRQIELAAGSFRTDPLPHGADTITLVRLLYDHADATVEALLARVADALPPGGRVIVSEPMSGGAHPSRFGDAYFAVYTMAMRTGQVRSPSRIASLLAAAGFVDVRAPRARRPFITQIVTAHRSASR